MRPSRPSRRTAFRIWDGILVLGFAVGAFGLIVLVIGWFESREGVAGPVTELGYGALVGIVLTGGLLVQLRAPERKIAAMQQVLLVIPSLVLGSLVAADSQNLIPALILVPALGILLVLHPARAALFRRGSVSPALLVLAVAGGIPLVAYALDMGGEAQEVIGPPHHVQRLSTMAALAFAILFTAALASLRTQGWPVPAWSAGSAAFVFGLATMVFADHPGAEGRWWSGLAIAGGIVFVVRAEWERRRHY